MLNELSAALELLAAGARLEHAHLCSECLSVAGIVHEHRHHGPDARDVDVGVEGVKEAALSRSPKCSCAVSSVVLTRCHCVSELMITPRSTSATMTRRSLNDDALIMNLKQVRL